MAASMAHVHGSLLPGHDPTTNGSGTAAGQDPYYSNHDITILHTIVATAQDELDTAPEPKPLPAAVLFKAYDEILPTFGIDPDSEQHLSAFIFRIGGEQGTGTLSDKFQLILGRMGIVLEFGDNSTASGPTSSTLSTSPAQSHSSRPNSAAKRGAQGSSHNVPVAGGWSSSGKVTSALHLAGLSVRRHTRGGAPNVHSAPAQQPTAVVLEDTAPSEPQGSRHFDRLFQASIPLASHQNIQHIPEAAAIGDRWRDLVGVVSGQRARGNGAAENYREENRELAARPDAFTVESTSPLFQDPHGQPKAVFASSGETRARVFETQDLTSANGLPDDKTHAPPHALVAFPKDLSDTVTEQGARSEGPEGISLRRAARAREIYLASKFFNRWASRTATKLEREAVARRHMIRFRCFQGWSKAPGLNVPAADNLRATTAVQKLRRAIAHNEQQLGLAAAALARSYQRKLVQLALAKWACQVVRGNFTRKLASQAARIGIKQWSAQAQDNAVLVRATSSIAARGAELGALHKWSSHAEGSRAQIAAARDLAAAYRPFMFLDEWVNQAELARRAREYHLRLQEAQLSTACDVWGMQAREQAFCWRREYISVAKTFDQWAEKARWERAVADVAQDHCKSAWVGRAFGKLGQLQVESSHLSHLQARSCLFIRSSRLLAIFDAAMDRRKHHMRAMVRRYLMTRYTQMSSKRRKRNFFSALDRWRRATQEHLVAAQAVVNLQADREASLCRGAIFEWQRSATKDQQVQVRACNHFKQAWMDAWAMLAEQHGAEEASAWDRWAAEQQRHSLKAWSIAALQRNGQAHTANVVRQRHDRDNRVRALQRWRKASVDPEPDGRWQPLSTVASRIGAAGTSQASWKSVHPRLSYLRQEHDHIHTPMQTPTRWTGTALPMASTGRASRFMATVQEADDESTATSSVAGDAPAWGRFSQESVEARRAGQLPSTTPKAPVPAYLERQRPRQLSLFRSRQLDRNALAMSVPMHATSRHVKANQPSATAGAGPVLARGSEQVKLTASLQGSRPRRTRTAPASLPRLPSGTV